MSKALRTVLAWGLYFAGLTFPFWYEPSGDYVLAMDPATAMLIAGVLSATGNVAGGLLSRPDDVDPLIAGYSPQADPLLAALSADALLGLGSVDSGIMRQANPFAQIENAARQTGAFTDDSLRHLQQGLAELQGSPLTGARIGDQQMIQSYKNLNERQMFAVRRAAALAGYDGIEGLLSAQVEYEREQKDYEDKIEPYREETLQGRLAALSGISRILKDFPTASNADIDMLTRDVQSQLQRDISRMFSDERDKILEQANMGGFNPGAALGRLMEQETIQQSDSKLDALTQAITLLGGRQSLASNALGSLQTAFMNPQQLANQTASIRTNAATNAAGIAAQQAAAMNQMNAQTEANRAQATGAGVAGAFNSASSILNTYAMMDWFEQIKKSPGSKK